MPVWGHAGALYSRRLHIVKEHTDGLGELVRALRLRGDEPCERTAGIVSRSGQGSWTVISCINSWVLMH